jgi:hypothetical protein
MTGSLEVPDSFVAVFKSSLRDAFVVRSSR